MQKMGKKFVMPGDELCTLEEFEPLEGAYIDDGKVRAEIIGQAEYDIKNHVVKVKPLSKIVKIPKKDDEVIGQVENVQPNLIAIRIDFVNGQSSNGSFVGILITSSGRKGNSMVKLGDVVKAHVLSRINGALHLTFKNEDGVIFALCSICGGKMVRTGSRIKCVECGNVEERKLSKDYGNTKLFKFNNNY
jgi:exosome complex component CSL4